MSVLRSKSTYPAFRRKLDNFHLTEQSIPLISIAFSFSDLFINPIIEPFSDKIVNNKIFSPSLLIFGITGDECIYARDLQILLLFRIIQEIKSTPFGVFNIRIISDICNEKGYIKALRYKIDIDNVEKVLFPFLYNSLAVIL
ncbi:MAG: hypothetical protein EAX96_10110 [Candidatus Lokiarchaeota archaeon]|nr:hypothetical protein [Candidatus Lokiarchaeota archaeon]